MDDTPAPAEPTLPIDPPTTAGADPLRRILEALVPEAGQRVTFRDLTGAVHTAPAFAPMRVQARLLGLVRDHQPLIESVTSGKGAAGILNALADDRVVTALVEAMELLHPRAVREARVNYDRDSTAPVDPGDLATMNAGDLFAVEEVVQAVLPFFASPVLRLLDAIQVTGLGGN